MEAGGDSHTLERLLPFEPFPYEAQHRHGGFGPFDLEFTLIRQPNISHIVIH
jgi:hypothetical protein